MVKMFTILLIAFSAWSLANGEDSCPPEDDLYPCYCFDEEEGMQPEILCEKIKDIEEIKKVLEVLKGKDFAIGFKKVNFGEIPSDFFKGQSFYEVSFGHCSISSFGEEPFSGLEDSVERIAVHDSFKKPKTNTKPLKLDHLKKLKSVEFENNDFRRVGNEWFANGPTTVTEVNLVSNNIEELGDKVFAQLVNLRHVFIADNPLKQVSRSMFPNPAPKLYLLELSLGQIPHLPEDMFEAMPNLKVIILNDNKLVTMPQNTWKPVWNQLEKVYIDYNELFVCDQRIRWIYEGGKFPSKVFEGTCYGKNALTGKKLANLTLSDFD